MNGDSNALQISMAIIALVLGVIIYLVERSGTGVYFLPDAWEAISASSWLGRHLPGLLHTFAFSIFTAALLAPSRAAAVLSCLFWVLANSLFEFGQLDAVATEITGYLPTWFKDWPVLENLNSYFLAGTFDPVDVVFIVLGGAAAFVTMAIFDQSGDSE